MFQPRNMNWDKLFKQNPNRWLPVYNNEKCLIEVHDTETGNSWYSIGNNRWMFV